MSKQKLKQSINEKYKDYEKEELLEIIFKMRLNYHIDRLEEEIERLFKKNKKTEEENQNLKDLEKELKKLDITIIKENRTIYFEENFKVKEKKELKARLNQVFR